MAVVRAMPTELNQALESGSALVQEEVGEIRLTLDQLASLATDASYQVHEGISNLTDLIDHHSGLLTLFVDQMAGLVAQSGSGVTDAERQRFKQELADLMLNGKDLSRHLGQVLRSLQVADMMTQLVHHCHPGLERITEVMVSLQQTSIVEPDRCRALKQRLEEMLQESRERLGDEGNKPVHQSSVDEGSVEFF